MADLSTMSDVDLIKTYNALRGQAAPQTSAPQSFQQQTNAPADYGPPMPQQQSMPQQQGVPQQQNPMPVSSGGMRLSTEPPAPRPSAQQPAQPAPVNKSLADMTDDELIATYNQAKQRDQGGIARNFGAGADSALYATLGAPVDAANWVLGNVKKQFTTNPFDREANATPAQPLVAEPFGGSRSIAHMFGAAGVPDPETIPANTTGERIARGIGAGAGYAIAPEAALAGLTRAGVVAPQAVETLGQVFGRAESLGSMAGNAVAGATGGGTAAMAEEMVPDRYKPLAGTIGGLIGGAAGAAAASAPRAAGAGVRVVGEALDPLTAGGQQRAAGRIIRDAASNPEQVRSDLANQPPELVPGSRPTTFQSTGDMGLGSLERVAQTRDPAAFQQRRADQNAARLDALNNIQSAGHPEAVANTVRTRLAEIDTQTNADLYNALSQASARAEALGGASTPDAYGAALRDALRTANTAARENERALWRAVDPDGTLTTSAANLSGTAKDVLRGLSGMAAPLQGEEAAIFTKSAVAPQTVKFVDLIAMRTRINDALREEMFNHGESSAYRRLSRLRGAVENDIDGLVAKRAADDAKAVAAGQMSPEDAMFAKMLQQMQAWKDERQSAAASLGQSIGEGHGNSSTFGASRVPPTSGAQVPGGSGFRGFEGDQGLQGAAGPTFDEAARGRLNAATDATRERAQTFGATPNDRILKREGRDGPYDLPVSAVPSQIFFPGPKSFDAIQNFRRAVGDEQALAALEDYAAMQLRRTATQPDGTLKPQVVANWRRFHADALRAFPTLDRHFADAARASETVQFAADARRYALDEYQRGIVGKIVGVTDPADVTRVVGSIFGRQDSVGQMRRLAQEAGRTPEGREGLRKSVADFMTQKLISNTEAATSGRELIKSDQFQSFLQTNKAALKEVFNDNEIELIGRIAKDLQQANRSLTAVKIPGQSNTAQDAFAVMKNDSNASIFAKIIAKAGAAGLGATYFANPALGLAATIGTGTMLALRQAGIHRIEDLVREAMLDPSTANLLLARAPARGDTGFYIPLAKQLRRGVLAGEAANATTNSPPPAAPPPPRPAPQPPFFPPAPRGVLDTILNMGARR